MKKKKRIGVIVVGVFLLLTPFWGGMIFNTLSVSLGHRPQTVIEIIRKLWLGFIFYGILGIGIIMLNNRIRIITVVVSTAKAIGGFLGLLIGYIAVGPKIHSEIIKKYGASVITNIWLYVIIISLLFVAIAFYLTRPRVKEQFI